MYKASYLENDLFPNLYWGVNITAILFILPAVNFLVIPCCPKLTIRSRIGIGLVLYCIAGVSLLIIHAVPLVHGSGNSKVSATQLAFILIPALIIALAEVLTTVSGEDINHLYYSMVYTVVFTPSVRVHICPVSREYERTINWALFLILWAFLHPCPSSLLPFQRDSGKQDSSSLSCSIHTHNGILTYNVTITTHCVCVCVCVCRWWVQCSIWWLQLCTETDRDMMMTVCSRDSSLRTSYATQLQHD